MVQDTEVEVVEFKWGIKRGRGGKKKDVQFYESFVYDGVEYRLYDSVYMYKESEPEPFIGKIIKIWEHSDKTKKVKILWFFHPCEISNYLQGIITSENELFLASGNGAGLANINPLEAIAGKCNTICILEDIRNPQPSKEDIEEADFIYYRTFDVERCVVLEKINDEIAGVNVKLLFNKASSRKSVVLEDRDIFEKALVTKGTLGLPESKLGESKNVMVDVEGSSNDISSKQSTRANVKDPIVETPNSLVNIELTEIDKIGYTFESLVDGKSTTTSKGKEKTTSEHKPSLGVKFASNLGGQLDEGSIPDKSQKSIVVPINLQSKGKEILYPEKDASNSKDHWVRGELEARKFSASAVANTDDNSITMKDSGKVDGGQCTQELLDGYEKVYETKKKTLASSNHDSRRNEFKQDQISIASEKKYKRKFAKDSLLSENNSLKKPKVEGDLAGHVDDKSLKASPSRVSGDVRKSLNRAFKVTPRPEVEKKNKWFRGLPWKEWIPNAQEQGRLVLLQNFDPSYTSEEVQDIVWHAFGESCSAMILQRIAISSPYSGQAFLIFKTRHVAQEIVRKLDEFCLLSNGRPLVGSIANLSFSKKQLTYFGHIPMDRIKHHTQREMKEAVSTSHCSQPNNVEYDLAMEWCLWQERSELEWKRFYKQRRREIRDLEASLKSKGNEASK